MRSWKKLIRIFNFSVVGAGLLVPWLLFLNRFLIPDNSFDSINYHLYLGFKFFHQENNHLEFYPTGIHNFSSILDIPGYVLMKIFGYRIGSIGSLLFLYLSIYLVYKLLKLFKEKYDFWGQWWFGILFVSSFLSFESFLQIATYYVDISVACLMLASTHFLFKFEKKQQVIDLVLSGLCLALVSLGKMSVWYFWPVYFFYLIFVLFKTKKISSAKKNKCFLIPVLWLVLFLFPGFIKNYTQTGNPVFPFYNGIFKSKYFSESNFAQVVFGGRNLKEKILWGIYSIKSPERLGEVHDLFNDYKINIYFIAVIFILFWARLKKRKSLFKLSIFYLASFLFWSVSFGYLRYALFLEFLGAWLIILWFSEVDNKFSWLAFPVIAILLLQGKRVVNMSLAYDISFRPGYFYNRGSYPKEDKNFGKNKIEFKETTNFKPDYYLNCSIPGMTYYVLSDFNNLPVRNIDVRAYSDLTQNEYYQDRIGFNKTKSEASYVTIVGKDGLTDEYENCKSNLQKYHFKILSEQEVDNFLGFEKQKLVLIFTQMLN